MTSSQSSLGATIRRARLPVVARRLRAWCRRHDTDLRLFAAIALIVVGVLAAGLVTIREVERQLLKTTAASTAVHWAEFLQSRLRGLDEILAAGLVTEDDQRIFEFAGAAGGVQDYQVIRPGGVVALSNWSGDFRGATNVETLHSVIEDNRTITQVIEENVGDRNVIIGQAYVPLTSGAGKRGALKVDVDMTKQAARYRKLGNGAFVALLALLLPPGGLAGWLVARNIGARRRLEHMQRQRGVILEALAKGMGLDRVLLRVARYIERQSPGSICTVLALDPVARRVAVCVAPSARKALSNLVGQPLDTLPELVADSLSAGKHSLRPAKDGGAVWSASFNATSGQLLGCLILQFPAGNLVRAPQADGPEATLAQLATLAIEARHAENALAEMRQRNELILGAAADGIFGIDAAGLITFANPAAADMLGQPIGDIIGIDAEALLRPFVGQWKETPPIAATLTDGEARQIDMVEIRGRGGLPLPVQLVVTPIARRSSSLKAVVVLQDISAQIEAQQSLLSAKEEAEAASRSKSNFLAHMSHELRTPLNAIIGFSEVMAEQTLGPMNHPYYHEYSRHIHSSGQHLLSLINDLLDLSKIEAGKLELWEETVDLCALIERCQVFVADSAGSKGVILKVHLEHDLPRLHCDPRKLKQTLVNLLSNAIKFTPARGRIDLTAKPDDASGIIISVADSGVGIAPHHLDKVMSPFGQVHDALNRDTEGTGLGLPLSKSLIELHGGSLSLESVLGKGTVATVHLPGRAVRRAVA